MTAVASIGGLSQFVDDLVVVEEAVAEYQRARSVVIGTSTPDPHVDELRAELDLAIARTVTEFELLGEPAAVADRVEALPGFERWHAAAREDPQSTAAFSQTRETSPARVSSWDPVDLSVAGDEIEPPAVMRRADGKALLYPGRIHWGQGPPESLKSWFALVAAVAEVQAGNHVLVVDFEDGAHTLTSRLTALGLTAGQLAHVTYCRPDEPLFDHQERPLGAVSLVRTLEQLRSEHGQRFTLGVIDGVTEAMALEGLEDMKGGGVATWMRRLPKLLARYGPAVFAIDHITKNPEGAGRFAIGSGHKLAGVDGAAYAFKPIRPLARAIGVDEVTGVAQVDVVKDRPGFVRGFADQGVVGSLEVTAYPDGGITARLELPGGAVGPDPKLVLAILEHLAVYEGASGRNITESVGGKAEAIRAALRWMTDVSRALIRVEKSGQTHHHYLTAAGHQELGR